jgi:flavorubredoxin
VFSTVGALVSIDDFSSRPAKGMNDGEVFTTGQHRFRFVQTPHVPHCWEAGLLFEETKSTLLCSDLFHQNGNVEPLTETDVIDRARKTLIDYQAGPFANYMPYTKHTDGIMQKLAALNPRTIAPMHGSAFAGDGARALGDLAVVMREVLA